MLARNEQQWRRQSPPPRNQELCQLIARQLREPLNADRNREREQAAALNERQPFAHVVTTEMRSAPKNAAGGEAAVGGWRSSIQHPAEGPLVLRSH